jgi:hypothetical protein
MSGFDLRQAQPPPTPSLRDERNDLVVDTEFMIDFGVPHLQLADQPCDFGTSDEVWHCNYFRQPQTMSYITQKLN